MTNVNGTMVLVPPPPGFVVNFENPQRQLETQVYTVVAVENVLALAFLLQRLYTRIYLMRLFQVEDGKMTIKTARFLEIALTQLQLSSLLPGSCLLPLKPSCSSVGMRV